MEKTPELYDSWNEKKKSIELKNKKGKRVCRWEIWICNIGVNLGSEISKDDKFQRPVLILRDHIGGDLVLAIPTSTQWNDRYAQYLIPFDDAKNYDMDRPTYLVVNQIRPISTSRLVKVLNNIEVQWITIPLLPQERIDSILEYYTWSIYKKKIP